MRTECIETVATATLITRRVHRFEMARPGFVWCKNREYIRKTRADGFYPHDHDLQMAKPSKKAPRSAKKALRVVPVEFAYCDAEDFEGVLAAAKKAASQHVRKHNARWPESRVKALARGKGYDIVSAKTGRLLRRIHADPAIETTRKIDYGSVPGYRFVEIERPRY